MKDRVREAVFNLLGPGVADCHAIDLFAGTGALGLEALSRGAASATFLERHFPTAGVIRENIATLDVDDVCRVIAADTFIWSRAVPELPERPWIVFVSPPYDFYVDRAGDMLTLVGDFHRRAPRGSRIVVEADGRFDFAQLPAAAQWDVRSYPPAWVGILRIDGASRGA
jgi:16S rRNA (guanine966-N2)-methyltransferase